MFHEILSIAESAGYGDAQAAAAWLLKEMESDCAARSAEEAGKLAGYIAKMRMYLERMGRTFAQNRFKFMGECYGYCGAVGWA